jgi:predicted PurR-regulated permease PerM
MKDQSHKTPFLIGITVFILMAAFLFSAKTILSPVLIGVLLLFILLPLKENAFAFRLRQIVALLLFLWIFIKAQSVFFPFLAAFTLAYLLEPAVQLLHRMKVHRTLASILLIILMFGIIIVLGMITVPGLVQEVNHFIDNMPQVISDIKTKILVPLPKLLKVLRIDEAKFMENLYNTVPMTLQNIFTNLLKGVLGLTDLMGKLVNIILIPVLTFYILKDFNKLRLWFLSMFPKRRRPRVSYYLWRVNRIIGGYLRAQIVVAVLVGIGTSIGLYICHIQYAILLGVLTGLLNFIPYIGLYVSLAIAFFVALLDPSPLVAAIKVGAVFFVVQGFENAVLTPKITGSRVGLHPVTVVFSVLLCSNLFGFWGLIMGVPAASILMLFFDEWKRKRALLEMIDEGAYKNLNRTEE